MQANYKSFENASTLIIPPPASSGASSFCPGWQMTLASSSAPPLHPSSLILFHGLYKALCPFPRSDSSYPINMALTSAIWSRDQGLQGRQSCLKFKKYEFWAENIGLTQNWNCQIVSYCLDKPSIFRSINAELKTASPLVTAPCPRVPGLFIVYELDCVYCDHQLTSSDACKWSESSPGTLQSSWHVTGCHNVTSIWGISVTQSRPRHD